MRESTAQGFWLLPSESGDNSHSSNRGDPTRGISLPRAPVGTGGLLASRILVIVAAVGGYLLGSLGGSDKWVQSLGAGQHNIAAAMVVATMNFGSQEVVMIVVYSLITLVVMTPLSLELGKRNAKADAVNEAESTIAPA